MVSAMRSYASGYDAVAVVGNEDCGTTGSITPSYSRVLALRYVGRPFLDAVK